MKDAQNITDEEYTKMYKKYKIQSSEIFIKPNSILRRLFMIIIIFATVSAILYIIQFIEPSGLQIAAHDFILKGNFTPSKFVKMLYIKFVT